MLKNTRSRRADLHLDRRNMYNGYLLKINGVTIPNDFIVEDSYKPVDKPIIVSDYYDTEYNRHVIYAPNSDMTIEFTFRKMYESEYEKVAGLFSEEMNVEYYDFRAGTYKQGIFTCKEGITPGSYRFPAGNALLNEHKVKLNRKRVAL